jgi:flavodoxin
MKILICCATRSGNTLHVAKAIADGLAPAGAATIHVIDGPRLDEPIDADLVLVGGPTEGHGATPVVSGFLDALPAGILQGRSAAAFDTRLDWPRWLSGSAADVIAKRLTSLGARLIAKPESFLVSMEPELRPDELARARAWGAALAELITSAHPVPTGVASGSSREGGLS